MKEYPGTKFYMNLSAPIIGEDVRLIQVMLASEGLLKQTDVDGYFGVETERAVKAYQRKQGILVSGIVDKTTWDRLFKDTATIDDSSTPLVGDTGDSYIVGSNNKESFFNPSRKQSLRKNGSNIVITLGDNHRVKMIENVVFRSKAVVINASGEPIAETYDFIAKDLIESEEE